MERWFHREHAPDVSLNAPWLLKYDMYRAVNPPPEGAENYCFMNYRVHENITLSPGRGSLDGNPSMRPEPVEDAMNVAMFQIEPVPDDFYGAQRTPFQTPLIRWVCAIAYPEGISLEEGEKWYLDTHVPEMVDKCKDLLRFFSYRAVPKQINAANEHTRGRKFGDNTHLPFSKFSPLMFVNWARLTEIWFPSGNHWTENFIRNIPDFTKPQWATQDEYPFVIPGKEFCSTFLLERPTEDLLLTSEKVYYG